MTTDWKLRARMVWAIICGRSVCYRMDISPNGANPKTTGAMIVQNYIHGLNNGIVLDLNSRRSIIASNTFKAGA